MQKFEVIARAQSADGSTLVAPDGAYIEAFKVVEASQVHTAVNHVVASMSARFDKVMQRHYNSTPRLALNDILTVSVRRIA